MTASAVEQNGRVWTPERDRQLLALRQPETGRPSPWRLVTLRLGLGKSACQRRLDALNAAAEQPVRKPVAVREVAPMRRDGLDWLRAKKRISAAQFAAGMAYRRRVRAADAEGGAIKSSLDIVEGRGSGGAGFAVTPVEAGAEAKAWLFRVRHVLLKGQPDMITVLDAVCGQGHTLTALADGNDRRALELEAYLKVGLDLLDAHLKEGA